MALTTHERLRGVMHGVGHAGDRILEAHGHLEKFASDIPEGTPRALYLNLLGSIRDHAEQIKTTKDE